ncbi:predicted protein [Aspergillus terreus NIH2624]|uniref:Uncharacterized protein n=1 Tax=Aspergillus terreus (strain NIH 2624 / FGSC A1156) TaxID=341663 RepID=Q0CYW0_ASPTN|nr:uncharacterized protein ATEG_01124 [Aspergillus terreus NIH2624]EAU37881.1 predicted protein [Aspergillus terreus NIH2624]
MGAVHAASGGVAGNDDHRPVHGAGLHTSSSTYLLCRVGLHEWHVLCVTVIMPPRKNRRSLAAGSGPTSTRHMKGRGKRNGFSKVCGLRRSQSTPSSDFIIGVIWEKDHLNNSYDVVAILARGPSYICSS